MSNLLLRHPITKCYSLLMWKKAETFGNWQYSIFHFFLWAREKIQRLTANTNNCMSGTPLNLIIQGQVTEILDPSCISISEMIYP